MEIGAGGVPASLRVTTKNISGVGNPTGEPSEKRADWAKDLNVKTFSAGTEYLYFPCCYQAYDPSVKRVALATVDVLKKADVDFGILDGNLVCCGESIRKAGAESVFQNLVKTNTQIFSDAGVKKIVVTSPHCYNTFTKEYPEFGGDFEVIYITQLLAELIEKGKLKLNRELKKKITYHDSCYLGRHMDIYDLPRQVLSSVNGQDVTEMRDNREYALCCGGGSGRLWIDTLKGERFSDLRIEQAVETGADVLAISCPYCMLNFEDSLLSMDKSDAIEIKDIVELVQEAI
jgi:Fe-S oxidoreductase